MEELEEGGDEVKRQMREEARRLVDALPLDR